MAGIRLPSIIHSATFRFAALVFALQLVLAGVMLFAVRQLTQSELLNSTRGLVSELREDLQSTYVQGGAQALEATIRARLADSGNDDTVLLLAAKDGSTVIGNLGAWPPSIPATAPWRIITLYRIDRDKPEQMGVVTIQLPDGSRLLAGHVVENSLRLNRILEGSMLSALLLALPLALIGAAIAARTISGRLRRINLTARAVSAGDLSQRVAPDGSGDAFETLGLSINAMLERIEALVGELRIITDGLAHDLRSPLTRLKARLDRAIEEVGDRDAQGLLAAAQTEADTLLAMLATALQISRAEAGIGRDRFAATDLGSMIADLAEMYGPLAEERGFSIEAYAPEPVTATVHRELVGQAVANLVDNALKYGGGRIQLSARRTATAIEIVVADDGQGIPADRRAEAVRRFGRLDAARHVGGAGLGLALASAVARLHGGTLALEDNVPGLRVVLTIPSAGQAA
jgi:signal transduction histidine kinase